jgi:hypothetical protein
MDQIAAQDTNQETMRGNDRSGSRFEVKRACLLFWCWPIVWP